jgi:hypothetical protein
LPYRKVRFNPVALTLLTKALHSLSNKVSAKLPLLGKFSKSLVDDIAGRANGDIRSAIMSMEFSTGTVKGKVKVGPDKKKRKLVKEGSKLWAFRSPTSATCLIDPQC